MRYPLDNWKKLRRGYLFGVPTHYSKFHLGLDVIAPAGTPLYAWQDLSIVATLYGPQGGNTAFILCNGNKRLFRVMHLQKPAKSGKYKEGQIIGYIGNTGAYSLGSHLHIDISKNGILNLKDLNNFENPESYFNAFVK